MVEIIEEQLFRLREEMQREHLSAVIIPTTDAHLRERTTATAVVTMKEHQLMEDGGASAITEWLSSPRRDMDGTEIDDTEVQFVEVGDTFTLMNKAPEGYLYHHAYLDGTTTAPEPVYQITGNEGDMVIRRGSAAAVCTQRRIITGSGAPCFFIAIYWNVY